MPDKSEANNYEEFKKTPIFIKGKGAAKIFAGVMISLMSTTAVPGLSLVALPLGAAICGVAVVKFTVEKFNSKTWAQIKADLFKDTKDTMGMFLGVAVSALSPFTGIALTVAGSTGYLAGVNNFDGIFKGALLSTAVTGVALPVVGAAFVVEGIINSAGYDVSLVKSGAGYAMGLYNYCSKLVHSADKDKPSQTVAVAADHAKELSVPEVVIDVARSGMNTAQAAGKEVMNNKDVEHAHKGVVDYAKQALDSVTHLFAHHAEDNNIRKAVTPNTADSSDKIKGK